MRRPCRSLALVPFLLASFACDPTGPEAERVVLYVGPEQVECQGLVPQLCYLVKEDAEAEWTYFYDPIEGFEYEPGYTYKLLVREQQIENPPQDGSSVEWHVIRVLEKIAR